MSREHSKGRDRYEIRDVDHRADRYIEDRGGLQFDFDRYRLTIGSDHGDRIPGTRLRDYSFGLAGNDRLSGGSEDDFLYGDAGNDLLVGAGDQDRLTGGTGRDRLYGGELGDDLAGDEGDDYLDAGAGHDDLEGGAGHDIYVGGLGADAFAIDPMSGNDVVRDFTAGPALFDHVVVRGMTAGDLRITQTESGALVSWDVSAGQGSILLEGVNVSEMSRDDFMFTDVEGGDLLPEGREPIRADFFRLERNASENPPDIGGATINRGTARSFDAQMDSLLDDGGISFDFDRYNVIIGGDRADAPRGTSRLDHFIGRGGNDRFDGRQGNDVIQGDAGNDVLRGDDGSDWIDGGDGNDRLSGGLMADALHGGRGRDYLDAGAGHDMLEGAEGNDIYVGGTGADAFIVDRNSGDDVVLDFTAGPGSFDHVALLDISADELIINDTDEGVLIAWDGGEDSILLKGVFKNDLVQDDFMFNSGPQFVPGISTEGSEFIQATDNMFG
ncbi:calcium-binding protein [Allosphingosinicella sp.]|uniref:calcium-binding protein n=1 Tax=Allosphingosinicella sp. TaxID=2823234 RepID=UPI002FC13472